MPDVRRFATTDELFRAARVQFGETVRSSVREYGRCMVALAGGDTPRRLYEELATDDLPWSRIVFFFGDERCVPPHHDDSNYRMVRDALFVKVPIPHANIHRIPSEIPDPVLAAKQYELTLSTAFDLRRRRWPRFDLVLLGLGTDGHTASLFPGSSALDVRDKLVTATFVESLRSSRITLTYPTLNASAVVLFLVSGAQKAQVLKAVLQGTGSGEPLPAQRVRPTTGRVIWMVDGPATSALDDR